MVLVNSTRDVGDHDRTRRCSLAHRRGNDSDTPLVITARDFTPHHTSKSFCEFNFWSVSKPSLSSAPPPAKRIITRTEPCNYYPQHGQNSFLKTTFQLCKLKIWLIVFMCSINMKRVQKIRHGWVWNIIIICNKRTHFCHGLPVFFFISLLAYKYIAPLKTPVTLLQFALNKGSQLISKDHIVTFKRLVKYLLVKIRQQSIKLK